MHKILAYTAGAFFTFYFALIFVITIPFVWLSLFIFKQPYAVKITKCWARIFMRLIACPITIVGEIPTQPVIFISNHTSFLDPFILVAVLPTNMIFTAKKEVLNLFLVGSFFKRLGYLPINKVNTTKNVNAMKSIVRLLKQNHSVLIFPEGAFRTESGLQPFKLGAFLIAVKIRTPLCPIALQGTRTIWPGNSWLLKPGRIKISFGTLLLPEAQGQEEIDRLHYLARNEIAKNCGESS